MYNQPLKFILVGILNTIVGFGVYYICYKAFDLNYFLSLIISHVIGVIHSFVWNKNWTFNVKQSTVGMVAKFISIYIITFIINSILLIILVENYVADPVTSQLIATVITTGISFFGQKYWSFRQKKTESEL